MHPGLEPAEYASMRIALISTTAIAVPPKAYGGTELITAELAKMLTRRGHEVTVYATGDSRPQGNLRYRFPSPIWPPNANAELRHAAFAWSDIRAQRDDQAFDIVHAHQAPALAFAGMQNIPTVLTIHHPRDPSLLEYYRDFPQVAYVAISHRQEQLVPELGVRRVIHHGLDPAEYTLGRGEGDYAAFLGRLASEKGPHTAIDAARLANVQLRIGGAAHWNSHAFLADELQPRLDAAGGDVTCLGELAHAAKVELLRGARATLFPIEWEEPFGLVMIESMLVGTPVIAFGHGSVPEIVEEGVTGFVVRNRAEMTERLVHARSLDRALCQKVAVERWGSMRMARDYEQLFLELCEEGAARHDDSTHRYAPRGGAAERVGGGLPLPDHTVSSELFSPFWKVG